MSYKERSKEGRAKWAALRQDRCCGCYSEAHKGINHISLDKAKPGGSSLAFVGDMDHSWHTWKHGAERLRELSLDSDVMGEGERREL